MDERPLILHDFFNAPDGGGRVARMLAESFNAQLWAGHLNSALFPKEYFGDVELECLMAYETSPLWLRFSKILQLWWAFAHFPERKAPWTLFSGSFSPLAYKKIHGKKILYCLTPPRLLYDQKKFMLGQISELQRPFLKIITGLYRIAYQRSVNSMDIIVTISETVRRRTRKFLRRDSRVIYPPCEIDRFQFLDQQDFFLSTARLDPLKRVDLIVEAFLKMPKKNLVVVSGGSEIHKIKETAERGKNIQVLGWVGEEKLQDLTGKCIATVYIPRDEDFGMSPVESMAAGKPVIGVQEGGLLETVGEGRRQRTEDRGQTEGGGRPSEIEKKKAFHGVKKADRESRRDLLITDCGVLVPEEPKVEHVIKAVEWMTSQRALEMRWACEARAKKFSKSVFEEKMREVIEGN